jgi:hypothetical protein
MRTAELLNAMAAWLESSNNEAMLLAEADEKCMQVVAESCVLAAALLKKAADEVDILEAKSQKRPEYGYRLLLHPAHHQSQWQVVYTDTKQARQRLSDLYSNYSIVALTQIVPFT